MATYGISRDVPLPAAETLSLNRGAVVARALDNAPPPPPVAEAIPYDGESEAVKAWRSELRRARSTLLHTHLIMVLNIERASKAIIALEMLGVAP